MTRIDITKRGDRVDIEVVELLTRKSQKLNLSMEALQDLAVLLLPFRTKRRVK